MKLIRVIETLRQRPRLLIRGSLALLAALVPIDALPFVVDKTHAHTAPERLPGFWSVFGFAACVLIIVVSKAFGKAGIVTREDYYDE